MLYNGDMAEMRTSYRVVFPQQRQQKFFEAVLELIPVPEAANLCSVSERTIRDWKRGKYLASETAVRVLSERTSTPVPKNIQLRSPYWYTSLGARRGAQAVLKKYGRIGGDPAYRKRRWKLWWEQKGRHMENHICKPLNIKIPRRNEKLAEFVGILMGDGGISRRQVSITLHGEDDKEYSKFVQRIFKELFGVQPSVYKDTGSAAINIVVSRTRLVQFCKSMGLHIGNKLEQGLDIPHWIMQNDTFRVACMRGLMDTDGCIFNECHQIKGKRYCYPRMHFVSASPALRSSVHSILTDLGFKARIRNGRSVSLERKTDIVRYFHCVGSSNPKHLARYKEFLEGNRLDEELVLKTSAL